ncbi:hypothetical protein O1M63_23615 [Streptomyces mirabilis]|nr:hypothetical protein [Streptomyces mirabilis]
MPPNSQSWGLYRGTGLPGATPEEWPEAPAWRSFGGGPELPPPPVEDPCAPAVLGTITQPLPAPPDEVARVNVALHLRRPLLVTGEPGTGKSSLAYRISGELGLGPVLRWQITSLSTLREGLYDGPHDATYDGTHEGRDEGGHDGGIRLGPLGTAFLPYRRPRVLLIDRLDRAEISLPEDLCTVLTAGGFSLPGGAVRCRAFPVVVITTTGERDLPSDLVRRCVTLRTQRPGPDLLRAIAANRFPAEPGRPARRRTPWTPSSNGPPPPRDRCWNGSWTHSAWPPTVSSRRWRRAATGRRPSTPSGSGPRRRSHDGPRPVSRGAPPGLPESLRHIGTALGTTVGRTAVRDVAVVADAGPTMGIWHRTVHEFATALHRCGALGRITTHRLPYGHSADPATLPRHRAGTRLTLLLTDGAGPRWRTHEVEPLLRRWGQSGPLALIHLLPHPVWHTTGLRGWQVLLRSPAPGAANHRMRWRPRGLGPDLHGLPPAHRPDVAVPVLELAPRWLDAWSGLLGGARRRGCR